MSVDGPVLKLGVLGCRPVQYVSALLPAFALKAVVFWSLL